MKEILAIKNSGLAMSAAISVTKCPEVKDEIISTIEIISAVLEHDKEIEDLKKSVLDLKDKDKVDRLINYYLEFEIKYGELLSNYIVTPNAHHKKKQKLLNALRESEKYDHSDFIKIQKIESSLSDYDVSLSKIVRRLLKKQEILKNFEDIKQRLLSKVSEQNKKYFKYTELLGT